MIINPKHSNWLSLWNYLIDICLLYGYIADPYYIAFFIAHDNDPIEGEVIYDAQKIRAE